MAKLTIDDHLDDMMERLMNEEQPEALANELRRSKGLCELAKTRIESDKNKLKAIEVMAEIVDKVPQNAVDQFSKNINMVIGIENK